MIDTEAQKRFEEHRRVWAQKPVLQSIYRDEFFSRLLTFSKKEGISVEVGAGPGFFKQMSPDIISTDLIWCPWLDLVADAQRLPFADATVTNVFGLDMLHHLASPMTFLREVRRVLVTGGRLILVEPWISVLSYFIYRYLHQEDCILSARPCEENDGDAPTKKAFDGNQAIPFLLFGPRHRANTFALLPGLTPLIIEPFCLFAYLLSLGFKPKSFLPKSVYPTVSKLERVSLPLWRSWAALRVLIVIEKSASG